MQFACFTWPHDPAGPYIQSAGMFTVKLQPLKTPLHPPPFRQSFLPGVDRYLWVLLSVTLKYAGTDEVYSFSHSMYQCLGVVDNEPTGQDTFFEPGHEVLWYRRLDWSAH